jgi:hypothetical protein
MLSPCDVSAPKRPAAAFDAIGIFVVTVVIVVICSLSMIREAVWAVYI